MKTSEDGRKLHMKGNHGCKECGFATVYEYGQRIYYCDHEGRVDGEIGCRGVVWGKPWMVSIKGNQM